MPLPVFMQGATPPQSALPLQVNRVQPPPEELVLVEDVLVEDVLLVEELLPRLVHAEGSGFVMLLHLSRPV